MIESVSILPLGYSALAPGQLANVVTSLEITERPATLPLAKLPEHVSLATLARTDLGRYRALFRAIGAQWLWSSRLVMDDDELAAILGDPRVDILVLRQNGEDIGLLELDFRQQGICELVFFGLVPSVIGQGLGRCLMNAALERAWSEPIRRFWLHTCTFDHPSAIDFYIRSGFKPFAFHVEVLPDPRLTGHLPRDAAPQVPLIVPA